MRSLKDHEISQIGGGDLSHLLGGIVVGGSVAAIGLYFPVIGIMAGCCAGAALSNAYSAEIDTFYQWIGIKPATT